MSEGGDPYQEITFNAGYGMRTTLQSVVDAGLLSQQEVNHPNESDDVLYTVAFP